MESQEAQNMQRQFEKQPRTSSMDYENENERTDSHYADLIKLKDDRLSKLTEKVKSLETDNEKLHSEFMKVKEENDNTKKKFIECDILRVETEAILQIEKKKIEDLKLFYEDWKKLDISQFFVGNEVKEDLIRKRLQYNHVQMTLDQEKIKLQQEIIKSLDAQVRLNESCRSVSTNSNKSVLDTLFGRTKLKEYIDVLTKENQILKEKEENITKLIKTHQLEIEEQIRKFEDLKDQVDLSSSKEIVYDDKIVEELIQAKLCLQEKEDINNAMQEKNDNLINENQNLKDKIDYLQQGRDHPDDENQDMLSQVQILKQQHIAKDEEFKQKETHFGHEINSLNLEYEQMKLKYNNAMERIANLELAVEPCQKPNPLFTKPNQTSSSFPIDNIESKLSTPDLAAPKPQEYNQGVKLAACPCCGNSFEIDKMEAHLEVCLEQQM